MNSLIPTLLSVAFVNAICIVPLALAAWAISRLVRQPAVTHALWVLILVKLVTPPLFQLPFEIDVAPPVATAQVQATAPQATATDSIHPAPAATRPMAVVSAVPTAEPATAAVFPTSASPAGTPAEMLDPADSWVTRASTGLVHVVLHPWGLFGILGVWLLGSLAWISWQATRAIRFEHCIRSLAHQVPVIDAEAARLAGRVGLRRPPQVLVVDATISPMLWGWGSRAKMLLPALLLERLDEDARTTLLAHELAHFRRGDHWIRLLELGVLGLFWWHPVAWWARSEIEESEEQCCDALVVRELTGSPRSYATALLDTIDFLCDTRPALPPAASGIGTVSVLRRRITRIMHGTPAEALSRRFRCALALFAAGILPLQPFAFAAIAPLPAKLADNSDVLGPNSLLNEAKSLPLPGSAPSSMATTGPAVRPPAAPSVPRSRRGERTMASAVSPRGRFLIQKTDGSATLLTDVTTGLTTDLSSADLTAIAFLPDESSFLAADKDQWLSLWNASTGLRTRNLLRTNEVVRSIAVAPDGASFAIGGRGGLVSLYDAVTFRPVVDLTGPKIDVNCVRFSPNGKRLAVASGDWMAGQQGLVTVWNLDTQTASTTLDFDSVPAAVAFASEDDLIVGQFDGEAVWINLQSRTVVSRADGQKEAIHAAAFSPDNPALQNIRFQRGADPLATQSAEPVPSFDWSGLLRLDGPSEASR